jgi:hypothetical protein
VLCDIALRVRAGEPVDVAMGHVNVIWQGDANSQVLRALARCTAPTTPLNVTGPETLSVRKLATLFAARFGLAARLTGEEADSAWLNDSSEAAGLFGYPRVPLARMIEWQAQWLEAGLPLLDKPTHFETRDGRY